LSVVTVISAYVNGAVAFAALVVAMALVFGHVPASALAYPFIALMMAPALLGLSWLLAAIGTYVRDASQFVGVSLSALMFLSPIFMPIERLPQFIQPAILANPVSIPVEAGHQLLFANAAPNLSSIAIYLGASIGMLVAGWSAFRTLRRGFADVV
jgi:lipopolysaccharide transport system permease protein